jgi:hypothetical protein
MAQTCALSLSLRKLLKRYGELKRLFPRAQNCRLAIFSTSSNSSHFRHQPQKNKTKQSIQDNANLFDLHLKLLNSLFRPSKDAASLLSTSFTNSLSTVPFSPPFCLSCICPSFSASASRAIQEHKQTH